MDRVLLLYRERFLSLSQPCIISILFPSYNFHPLRPREALFLSLSPATRKSTWLSARARRLRRCVLAAEFHTVLRRRRGRYACRRHTRKTWDFHRVSPRSRLHFRMFSSSDTTSWNKFDYALSRIFFRSFSSMPRLDVNRLLKSFTWKVFSSHYFWRFFLCFWEIYCSDILLYDDLSFFNGLIKLPGNKPPLFLFSFLRLRLWSIGRTGSRHRELFATFVPFIDSFTKCSFTLQEYRGVYVRISIFNQCNSTHL